MRVGILFSGGKDSALATFLAKKNGYEIACLITVESENPDSYMFHTPSIRMVEPQAELMGIPVLIQKTKGEKEEELHDLSAVLKLAKDKYKIEGIVTGAVESVYQASRVQSICNALNLECFNPLWQKDQFELLEDLIKERFEVILTGVFAYPLTGDWVGRKVDALFLKEMKVMNEKYKINPAGEGGEFETFVVDCPLFKRRLSLRNMKISGEKHSFRMEVGL